MALVKSHHDETGDSGLSDADNWFVSSSGDEGGSSSLSDADADDVSCCGLLPLSARAFAFDERACFMVLSGSSSAKGPFAPLLTSCLFLLLFVWVGANIVVGVDVVVSVDPSSGEHVLSRFFLLLHSCSERPLA
jgi:hypothetical protein